MRGFEHEIHAIEELTIEPPVDPGKLRDLVEGPFGVEDRADILKQGVLQFLRKGRDRQARDHVVNPVDPAILEDRAQVAYVPLNNLDVGPVPEPLLQQANEVVVALDDHNAAFAAGPLGHDAGDRAGPRSQLEQHVHPVPGDVADGRPR